MGFLICLLSSLMILQPGKDIDNENAASDIAGHTLKVLQLNLWCGMSRVPGAMEGLACVLQNADPDAVFLCEATDGNDTTVVSRLVDLLHGRGVDYCVSGGGHSVCMLTRQRPVSEEWTCRIPGEEGIMLKVVLDLYGRKYAFYSLHLDYRNYACYLPRGYSGETWEKTGVPVTDSAAVLAANRKSYRDEGIASFIETSAEDLENGMTVIAGGDFNEPSCLDWTEATGGMRDHNGAVIPWDCSVMLLKAGFRDVFRSVWPDPVLHPGFTYPAGNRDAVRAGRKDLSWAPEADERERIDFIYYFSPDNSVQPETCLIVGPDAMICRGILEEDSDMEALQESECVWPSDHRGNLAVFRIP